MAKGYQELADHAAPPEGTCPEPERLWSAVRGELPPEERRRLVLHTVECAWCTEAWRLAHELRARAGGADWIMPRARWWTAFPLAAALGTVVLAGGLLQQQDGGALGPALHPPRERGGHPAVMAEDRPLPRAAFVLRWTPAGEGARYDLRVSTPALALVYAAHNLTATEAQVPPSALAALPRGARLLWQVEVVAANGTRTASPTFIVRLE